MSSSAVSPKPKHVSPASQVTPEQMEIYRAAARRRAEQGLSPEAEALRQRALVEAKRAAEVLKEEFGATRVVVFGSAAHGEWFTETSDIDLAVWQLPPEEYFKAWGRVEGVLRTSNFHLVDVEHARPSVLRSIERDGIEL